MNEAVLSRIRDLIQEDVGNRGLGKDPTANLLTFCSNDFAAACRHLAATPQAKVLIVTGFTIPGTEPPMAETDGPLGALFLARALTPLGIEVLVATDGTSEPALHAGLEYCQMQDRCKIIQLPLEAWDESTYLDWVLAATDRSSAPLTHLIALERVGPNHTSKSLQVQPEGSPWFEEFLLNLENQRAEGPDTHVLNPPPQNLLSRHTLTPRQYLAWCRMLEEYDNAVTQEQRDRCFSMAGIDITAQTSPAHLLFEHASRFDPPVTTIGIGDGGNEIGMGKIPWNVIQRNIPNGGLIACRIPTDHLIVCGVSNWGAYGLAAGVRLLRGSPPESDLFNTERERLLLQCLVDFGPLVDGRTKGRTPTVDGLSFERYAEVMEKISEILRQPEDAPA